LKVLVACLFPIVKVLDFDLVKCQLSLFLVNLDVHFRKFFLNAIRLAEGDVPKLGDSFQDRVDQLHVERAGEKEEHWLHLFLLGLHCFRRHPRVFAITPFLIIVGCKLNKDHRNLRRSL
jgi:hypothetical protein